MACQLGNKGLGKDSKEGGDFTIASVFGCEIIHTTAKRAHRFRSGTDASEVEAFEDWRMHWLQKNLNSSAEFSGYIIDQSHP